MPVGCNSHPAFAFTRISSMYHSRCAIMFLVFGMRMRIGCSTSPQLHGLWHDSVRLDTHCMPYRCACACWRRHWHACRCESHVPNTCHQNFICHSTQPMPVIVILNPHSGLEALSYRDASSHGMRSAQPSTTPFYNPIIRRTISASGPIRWMQHACM